MNKIMSLFIDRRKRRENDQTIIIINSMKNEGKY